MRNKLFALILACSSLTMMGQDNASLAGTQVSGEAELKGGVGYTSPFMGKVKLDIRNNKLTISPYLGVTTVNRDGSDVRESIGLTYRSSGNEYFSEKKTRTQGYEMMYGADCQFELAPKDLLSMYYHGSYSNKEINGSRKESVYQSDGTLVSQATSTLRIPQTDSHRMDVGAKYRRYTNNPGEALTLSYKYSLQNIDDERELTITGQQHFTRFAHNTLSSEADIHDHQLQFDWRRPLGKIHKINAGARYENRLIDNTDVQRLDNITTLDEALHHRMQTGGIYAGYSLDTKSITLNAQVEYDYTRMQDKNLNDVIPQALIQWNINKQQSLTAQYAMTIIRPGLSLLNPAHIIGTYTEDYGNPTLEGVHANNVSLIYRLQQERLTFSTTLQHIFAEDGFCAMWMERDDIRISTWGNMGVRRAWQLVPKLEWQAWKGSKINADGCIIWDKRIADAIHMQKEHWGYSMHGRVNQQLPQDFTLGFEGEISEGKTQDLYSHAGRQRRLGADVSKRFLKNKNLTATLAYQFCDQPNIILTQGAYKGHVYNRADNWNTITLGVKYAFK